MFYPEKIIEKEVSIPYPLYESKKGNYFIGQTPILSGKNQHAIAALANPNRSNVNLYLNAITVTNNSSVNLSAEVYLKSYIKNGQISDLVSCANQSIIPEPISNGKIIYLDSVTNPPQNGVAIFSRIVPPFSTLVIDGGQIILPPGQGVIIYLGNFLTTTFDSAIFAFGWWEENICRNYY